VFHANENRSIFAEIYDFDAMADRIRFNGQGTFELRNEGNVVVIEWFDRPGGRLLGEVYVHDVAEQQLRGRISFFWDGQSTPLTWLDTIGTGLEDYSPVITHQASASGSSTAGNDVVYLNDVGVTAYDLLGGNDIFAVGTVPTNGVTVNGGAGNDIFFIADGPVTLNGGADRDTVVFARALATPQGDDSMLIDPTELTLGGVRIDLSLTGAQTTPYDTVTLAGIENVVGTAGNDTLIGNASDNVLSGDDGDDSLSGGDGDDSLFGWGGDDTLTGGDGADQFVIAMDDGGQRDVITDFDPLTDTLVFSFAEGSFPQGDEPDLEDFLDRITVTELGLLLDGSADGQASVLLEGIYDLEDLTTQNIRLAYYSTE
jgi:hypothetical protein